MSKPQLFCFTYAGGNASFFDAIEKELNGIEVIKCEYSGHGVRHKESLYRDFSELADDVFSQVIQSYRGGEYALFGFSMGTITLIEVLRRILDHHYRKPACVFLAAHEPHTKSELVGFAEDELDRWVKERTIEFGAVPEELVENKTFWRTYLPLYRADYSIIGKYRFEDLQLVTTVPAMVFYSETDTPLSEMKKWGAVFTGECNYYRFEGNHFFIRDHHREMAEIIRKKMFEKLSPRSTGGH